MAWTPPLLRSTGVSPTMEFCLSNFVNKKKCVFLSVPIQRDQRALSSTDDLSPHDVQMVEIIIDARYQTLPEICHIWFGTFVTFGLGTFVTVED